LGLIVFATVGFVIGTTIERNSRESRHESAATLRAEGKSAGAATESKGTLAAESGGKSENKPTAATDAHREASAETGGDAKTAHADTGQERAPTGTAHAGAPVRTSELAQTRAGARVRTSTEGSKHAELKPLGINVEAVPFVVLAAVASLALALAAWLRPRIVPLLLVAAGAMLAFGLLDVREVFHQSDESRTGLAVLAGVVAALHLSAVVVGGVMAGRVLPPRRGDAS
jgi:hypothetical protein